MKLLHASENDLQQYAVDKAGCSGTTIDHIKTCSECLSEVNNYRMIFSEIKQSPVSAFDFNLEKLVMPQLPTAPPLLTTDRFVGGFLAVFISCCIGIPVYILRRNILDMFMGIPPVIIYIIIASTAISLSVRIFSMYKNFQHKMRFLNFN